MSRVILSRYESGQERVVAGYDHPAQGYFWQIFNEDPVEKGELQKYPDDWEEVSAYGGMWPGIPTLNKMIEEVPDEVKQLLIDPEVMIVLTDHARNPHSGRIVLDMTEREKH